MSMQSNLASDSFSTASFLDSNGNTQPLATGDIYQFRVTARNIVGDSLPSSAFSAMAATLSGAPGTPTRQTSTLTSITIKWTEPVDNGGDPIRDYEVFWD